ncbi:hypothetical protein ACIGHG_08225 [Bacillus sp. NPDC077411]|uniref:hypothetical protein n=1 Tax=Bacillus sp. NPDC077411 TaxID=3363947 RepID=UPI0037C614C7
MQLKISENMIYFWKNGHLIIDDFIRHEQYSLELSVFPILGLFKEWNDLCGNIKLQGDIVLL